MISYKLYAITDKSWLEPGESLADAVEQALIGGATIVQYRQKTGASLGEAKEIQNVCRKYHVPFIVNDNVELAMQIEADGVHLGQSDMSVTQARKLLGQDKIIGATAKTVDQAQEAYRAGASYLGSGAVFGSTTKLDARPMTLDLLREICQSVPIPVVAIGGIDAGNAQKLSGLPLAGIAVVSGIFAQKNKLAAALKLRELWDGRPVVQCITNHVTVNDVANLILTAKASPIMAHHIKEVEAVQEKADALLLNLGATDDYDAMKKAALVAKDCHHPIVIDPVGVGVSPYRRNFFQELVKKTKPACVRGNYAEIEALCQDAETAKGLESDARDLTDAKVKTAAEYAKELAKKLGCIVVASGPEDFVTDGENLYCSSAGHQMQRELTGSGCMLSGAIAAALSRVEEPSIFLVGNTCQILGDSAYFAAQQVLEQKKGMQTFKSLWLDDLYSKFTYN